MGRKSTRSKEEIIAEKSAYFIKIAERRTDLALNSINALKGLTSATYIYTESQAQRIVSALRDAVDSLEVVLLSKGTSERFTLSRERPAEKPSTDANSPSASFMTDFNYLLKFVKESDSLDSSYVPCKEQLRSLWTAFCLRYNLEVDTGTYDGHLHTVWQYLCATHTSDNGNENPWSDYEAFDRYMGEFLC